MVAAGFEWQWWWQQYCSDRDVNDSGDGSDTAIVIVKETRDERLIIITITRDYFFVLLKTFKISRPKFFIDELSEIIYENILPRGDFKENATILERLNHIR